MSNSNGSSAILSAPVGVAAWLVAGSLPERIRWAAENGFSGVSLLQYMMDADPSERRDAVDEIRRAGLNLTYHGNVHHRRLPDGGVDPDFMRRVIDDVRWWNAAGATVQSVCFDPIKTIPTSEIGRAHV